MNNLMNMSGVRIPTEMCWIGSMAENWKLFKQKYEIFSGNLEKDSAIKIALLLNVIGVRGLKLFNSFVFVKPNDKNNFNKVIAKFEEHCNPEKNITYERFSRFQDYIIEKRDLSALCEFGVLTESLIKDKLVCGILDIPVVDRLLRIKDLTLDKATDVCRTSKETKKQLEEMYSANPSTSENSYNYDNVENVISKLNKNSYDKRPTKN